jgi:hypothetical protein
MWIGSALLPPFSVLPGLAAQPLFALNPAADALILQASISSLVQPHLHPANNLPRRHLERLGQVEERCRAVGFFFPRSKKLM